jgi:ABC-2 type transport system ATP-binding protein
MIRATGLSRRFEEVQAVQDLNLEVGAGEVFALLGPNGAGKTTVVRMLTALLAPSEGTAEVAGFRLGEADIEIRRRVGILTESPGLYDRLSARRNLSFFAELYEVEEIAPRVEAYLRMLGLWERRDEPVGKFSKGMRQKLAIARALLHEPQVLFLDEPTSGLDPEAARMVREYIGELREEGRTIFLCTHNLDEAERLCDRVAVINSRLLAVDTPAALRNQRAGRTVVVELRVLEAGIAQAIKELEFVRGVETKESQLVLTIEDPEENNPALVRRLVSLGAEIQFISETQRSLEDVYLSLVRDPTAKTDRSA